MNTTERNIKLLFFVSIALLSFVWRLIPHLPNFTPIGALAMMSGAHLQKRIGIFVPLFVMLASDFFIGSYSLKLMAAVYGSFLIYVLLGTFSAKKSYKIIGGALLGSIAFFLITNFAVWAFTPWYTKDITGLLLNYALAVPFFQNTLAGDLLWTSAFVGAYEVVFQRSKIIAFIKKKPISLSHEN